MNSASTSVNRASTSAMSEDLVAAACAITILHTWTLQESPLSLWRVSLVLWTAMLSRLLST